MEESENVELDDGCCFSCKEVFEDAKSVAQCTACRHSYHVRCENIELRGFHLRRSYWKCKNCEVKPLTESCNIKQSRQRKRSRTDDNCVEQCDIDFINSTLQLLVNSTSELKSKIDFLIKENESLKQEIVLLKQHRHTEQSTQSIERNESAKTDEKQRSYAKALKGNGVLIVKPKQQNDTNVNKLQLQQTLSNIPLNVGITGMRDGKGGTVVVRCKNNEDANKLKTTIETNLSKQYSTAVPAKKKPCIKIVGIQQAYSEEELIRTLRLQNENLVTAESNIKLVISKKMIKTYFAILQCDTITYSKIMDQENPVVFIGCGSCRCYEYVSVHRCYNCNRFDHLSKDCKSPKLCNKCGSSGHTNENCTNDLSCVNCREYNDKHNAHLNHCHTAYDLTCPTYAWIRDRERRRIEDISDVK